MCIRDSLGVKFSLSLFEGTNWWDEQIIRWHHKNWNGHWYVFIIYWLCMICVGPWYYPQIPLYKSHHSLCTFLHYESPASHFCFSFFIPNKKSSMFHCCCVSSIKRLSLVQSLIHLFKKERDGKVVIKLKDDLQTQFYNSVQTIHLRLKVLVTSFSL